jgi:hypothetical protein
MEIGLLKKVIHNWMEALEQEASTQKNTIPAVQIIAIVQCELLLHIWEKLDSVEAGIFTVLARLPE